VTRRPVTGVAKATTSTTPFMPFALAASKLRTLAPKRARDHRREHSRQLDVLGIDRSAGGLGAAVGARHVLSDIDERRRIL
jgi:hypothetical protein